MPQSSFSFQGFQLIGSWTFIPRGLIESLLGLSEFLVLHVKPEAVMSELEERRNLFIILREQSEHRPEWAEKRNRGKSKSQTDKCHWSCKSSNMLLHKGQVDNDIQVTVM